MDLLKTKLGLDNCLPLITYVSISWGGEGGEANIIYIVS